MNARMLRALLALVKKLDDLVLYEVATMPVGLQRDYIDRVIVAVAKGEREWRHAG